MALETVVFQQDPFSDNSCKDLYSYNHNVIDPLMISDQGCKDSSSPENSSGEVFEAAYPSPAAAAFMSTRQQRKRRRAKIFKNEEEVENQRMRHIAVERNRRKQMNDHLAVLRSLMPPSYSQRGDQGSIVGGSINFVKELEHLVLILEAQNNKLKQLPSSESSHYSSALLSSFFTFPQFSTCPATRRTAISDMMTEGRQSEIADIEVSVAEGHANVKVLLSTKRPKQLLKMIVGIQSIGLAILHLSVTSVDQMVLYSFTVEVEDGCQLTTGDEIASVVHEMLRVKSGEILRFI